MYPSPNIKFAVVVASTIIAVVGIITGGIVYGVRLSSETERTCLESNRVYVRYTCLERASDLRYLDD